MYRNQKLVTHILYAALTADPQFPAWNSQLVRFCFV